MNKTSKMKWVKLRDTFEELIDYRGLTPKKLKGEWSDKGIRALSALHVKTTGLTNLENIRFVSPELYKRWMRKEVQKGDILLTSEAPAGQVMVWDTDEKIVLSQRLYGIRVNTRYNNYYIKYYLQSEIGQQEIKRNSSGSTVFGISARMFDRIKVPYKKLENQIAIGKTLKALDEKIKVNNKINQELEAMAKTLYDYWFVQFDFPAYLSGTLSGVEGYKSSGGKMVYNEELKREIPEGWEVKELDEVSEIKRGTLVTAKTADLEGNIKVVSAGLDYSYLHSESNRERNTITVSSSGANAGFINFWREPIFANDCTTVRGKTDTETLIYLQFLKMRQDHIFKQAKGSAQPHVYPKDLSILKIELPNNDLFKLYGEKVLSANEIITNNLKQNQKLAALRDWLLPMLMNGQVTVEDAYVAKEEVLGMVAEDKSFYRKEKE